VSTKRIDYQQVPAVMQALYAPGKALQGSGLEPKLLILIQMRASQINGCAFCLHLHALEAEALGDERKRLDILSAWREATQWYTPRERAALEWTEALTLVAERGMPDDLYARVAEQFSAEELASLTLAVTTINAWNRFNVAFHTSPDRAEAVFHQLHSAAAHA
jgi:AhpD family alkylhydroperoxidase